MVAIRDIIRVVDVRTLNSTFKCVILATSYLTKKANEVWENIIRTWKNIMDSDSEHNYKVCTIFEYVEGTIMGLVKEKVARAWTDRVMHLGNTTTNKVEPTYAQLKKFVANSFADTYKNWESIDQMMMLQVIELHWLFETSINSL
jgi:alpha-glucosidase